MVASKLSPEERLLKKRQAARLRQQRCRARKREKARTAAALGAALRRASQQQQQHQCPTHTSLHPQQNLAILPTVSVDYSESGQEGNIVSPSPQRRSPPVSPPHHLIGGSFDSAVTRASPPTTPSWQMQSFSSQIPPPPVYMLPQNSGSPQRAGYKPRTRHILSRYSNEQKNSSLQRTEQEAIDGILSLAQQPKNSNSDENTLSPAPEFEAKQSAFAPYAGMSLHGHTGARANPWQQSQRARTARLARGMDLHERRPSAPGFYVYVHHP